MFFFQNDYGEGAHPRVLEALTRTNLLHTQGYGLDPYCAAAAEKIRDLAEAPEAQVHFAVGGTQANSLVIASALRPYQAAVCVETGHINTHETGAVEATGHKILTATAPDGKLTPAMLEDILARHTDEHVVMPKLVYLSDATELGTIYTKAELTAISELCHARGLYLFLDGARLGAALTAPGNDLTLPDIARLTDVFYLGGTKNGLLFGEAIVITNPALFEGFRWNLKQRGAMLAKGRLLGVQFGAILEDNLYFELAAHANRMAAILRGGFTGAGFRLASDSPTNQVFVEVPPEKLERLKEIAAFEQLGGACRFVTSWATTEDDCRAFVAALKTL